MSNHSPAGAVHSNTVRAVDMDNVTDGSVASHKDLSAECNGMVANDANHWPLLPRDRLPPSGGAPRDPQRVSVGAPDAEEVVVVPVQVPRSIVILPRDLISTSTGTVAVALPRGC